MKTPRYLLALFVAGCTVVTGLSAQEAPAANPSPAAPETNAESTAEEVNVGASTLGATSLEVSGTATGLNDVLAGKEGASAQLTPAANGSAVAVIDLAGQADLSRVALNVGKAKGRLVVIALGEDGERVDLSTPDGAKKLITDKTLTGNESSIAVDVSQIKAKSVMLYWVPEEPGTALPITKVGIFTREAVIPEPTDRPRTVAVPPAPVVPAPQVVAAVRETLLPAGSAPTAPAPTTTQSTTTTTLPETIPPSSRAVSL